MSSGGAYDPRVVEPEIYQFWEQGGFFHAEPDPARKPYSIVIPPPNVTGALHLGHALNNTLQDILIRQKRMAGFVACWLPGTDHAGIATQAVVERRLKQEEGLSRRDVGREALVERIWKWKEQYNQRILLQLRRMGCSCDWERTRFTLDEMCAKAVYETFFRFFKDGLIFRGKRLVNWDCELQTAVADDEVYHETVRGHLWHMRYPLLRDQGIEGSRDQGIEGSGDQGIEGSRDQRIEGLRDQGIKGLRDRGIEGRRDQENAAAAGTNVAAGVSDVAAGAPAGRGQSDDTVAAGLRPGRGLSKDVIAAALQRAAHDDAKLGVDYLVVATTRPETMLGDSAVAVHPHDERYMHLIGKQCLLPLMNRPIPIIADGQLVKAEFGTGCVKVTPAHDPNDYACGLRHGLEMINILTPDGKINENGRGKGSKVKETEGLRDSGIEGLRGFDYAGLHRHKARKQIVADLESLGLLEKTEDHETDVGHSDRSKTQIEPFLSEQWFVKTDKLAESAMEAVRDGRVRFFPPRYAKTYLDWLGEKRDWCISRQLWWGHRIPVWRILTGSGGVVDDEFSARLRADQREAWQQLDAFFAAGGISQREYVIVSIDDFYLRVCGGSKRAREALTSLELFLDSFALKPIQEGGEYPVSMRSVPGFGDATEAAENLTKVVELRQDPDVLDTWFSSALWPHSTFGWPESAEGATDQESKKSSEGDTSIPRSLDPSIPQSLNPSIPSDLNYFYPTNVLSTARDIITLWVARMVMTGLYNVGRVPFAHVSIHPIIQDGQGRRMSKSAGNGVDPLDLIEAHGADAMRFTLASMAGETQDIRMPVKPVKLPDGRTVNSSERFELGRNFCNKLWQVATGFVIPNVTAGLVTPNVAAGLRPGRSGKDKARSHEGEADRGGRANKAQSEQSKIQNPKSKVALRPLAPNDLQTEDHWILSRLNACIEEVDRRLASYQYSDAIGAIYTFFRSEFCDWYVELIKPRLYDSEEATERRSDEGGEPQGDGGGAEVARQVLAWVMDQTLRLLHPVTPFITEALWKRLNEAVPLRGVGEVCPREAALITAAWPDAGQWKRAPRVEQDMAALQDVIRALRDIRARVNAIRSQSKQAALKTLPSAVIRCDADRAARLKEQTAVLCRLGRTEALEIGPDAAKPADSFGAVLKGVEVYASVAGLADLEIEKKRLAKQRDEIAGHIKRIEGKLGNQGFVSRAPSEVVAAERQRLTEQQEKLSAVERNLTELG